MRWWNILALVGAIALGWPLVANAQPPGHRPRIGVLWTGSPEQTPSLHQAFIEGLRTHGYEDGRNISLVVSSAGNATSYLPDLATALVTSGIDVLVTFGTPAAAAAKRTTREIPTVMAISGDPVVSDIVASLAKPGGNITGLSLRTPDLNAKRLQVLREAVPRAQRVAALVEVSNVGRQGRPLGLAETQAAARSLGLRLQVFNVKKPADLPKAFDAAVAAQADAVIALSSPLLTAYGRALAALATKSRLPLMAIRKDDVQAGALISYGPVIAALPRRAAWYVDRILKGAKPADLPVEQPTEFDLTVNLNTAKTLGLTVPPSILARADKVIE